MNPLASAKCARRLLTAVAAVSALMFLAACGGSSNSTSVNTQGFTNADFSGIYVISISGLDIDSSGNAVPFAIVGTIAPNGSGGFNTGGTLDINDPDNTGVFVGPNAQAVSTSSSYSVGKDGRGTATIVTTALTFNVDFVLISTSHGLISRFDDTSTTIGTGSGTMDLQTTTALTQSSLGSYAFSLGGVDSGLNPLGTVGAFTLNSSGTITSGASAEDFNDDGTSGSGYTNLPLSGQVVLGSSGLSGTATLTTSSKFGSLNFDFWPVDATHLKFMENDTSSNGVLLSGDAFTQATATTAGQVVFVLGGIDSNQNPISVGGYATTDTDANLTNGFEDYVYVGSDALNVVTLKPFNSVTGTSACVASTGRCQTTLNGFSNGTSQAFTFALYPSNNGAQVLEIDSFGLLLGSAFAQSATSFSVAGYGLNLSGQNTNGEVDDIAQFNATSTASPATNMQGNLDENDLAAGLVTTGLNATYTPDSNGDGRGLITAPTTGSLGTFVGALNLQYYVVNDSTALFIDVDSTALDAGQLGVGVFEAQTSPSSSVASRAMSIVRPLVKPHMAAKRK